MQAGERRPLVRSQSQGSVVLRRVTCGARLLVSLKHLEGGEGRGGEGWKGRWGRATKEETGNNGECNGGAVTCYA